MTDDKIEEIKDCPFCGHAGHVTMTNDIDRLFKVVCVHCFASRGSYMRTIEGAIEYWNERDDDRR